jgi:hypothetical protein
MIILHVTDLHLNERWFRWLAESAPPSDLLCISGDLLDRDSPEPHLDQVGLVAEWLRASTHDACLVLDSAIGARSEVARWAATFAAPEAGLVVA